MRPKTSLVIAVVSSALALAVSSVSAEAGPRSVRFVDVNADGRPDRISFAADGEVHVALNRGQRRFEEVLFDLPKVSVTSLLATDLDGDGHVDLYLAAQGPNVALVGDGTGRFPPPAT